MPIQALGTILQSIHSNNLSSLTSYQEAQAEDSAWLIL